MPFESKGPVAQWVMIYEFCERLLQRQGEQAELISFAEWEQSLHFDIRNSPSAIKRANKELLEKYGRVLVSVRGEGYRIDIPERRMGLIAKQKKRGLSHYVHAGELATYVPTDGLTAEQAAVLALEQRHLMVITNALARQGDQIEETTAALRDLDHRVNDRFSSLEEALRRQGFLPKQTEVLPGEVADPD